MKFHRSWSRLPLSLLSPSTARTRGFGNPAGSNRLSKKKRQRPRLGLEHLETRIVPDGGLTNYTFLAAQATALRDGLQGLANFGTTLDNFGQLANQLPILDQPLGQILNIADDLHKGLADPILNYINAKIAASATITSDLIETDVLKMLGGTFGNLTLTADNIIAGFSMAQNDVEFNIHLHAARTNTFSVDLGSAAAALGVSADGSAQVNTTASLDFTVTFGFDLTAGLSAAEAFFLRSPMVSAGVNASLVSGNFGAKVGFLHLDVMGATMTFTGSLGVGVANPDMDPHGNITLSEIQGNSISSLITLTPMSSFSVTLPIHASTGISGVPSAGVQLVLSDSDIFNGSPLTVTPSGSFSDLANFNNMTPSSMVGLLNQFGGGLQGLVSSLDVESSLVSGTPLGQALPFLKDKISQVVDMTQAVTGFARNLFDVVILGPNPAPSNGHLSTEADFALTFNNDLSPAATVMVSESSSLPNTNMTVDDLVADINAALGAAGIGSKVMAVRSGDRISLTATDKTILKMKLTSPDMLKPATQFGFQARLAWISAKASAS